MDRHRAGETKEEHRSDMHARMHKREEKCIEKNEIEISREEVTRQRIHKETGEREKKRREEENKEREERHKKLGGPTVVSSREKKTAFSSSL